MKFSSAGTKSPPLGHMKNSCAHVPRAVCTLLKGGQAKRTLFSKYWGSVLLSLTAPSDCRGQTEVDGHYCSTSPKHCELSPLWAKWGMVPSTPLLCLPLFPPWRDRHWRLGHSKAAACTGKIRKSLQLPRERCRLRKDMETLSLHLRWILRRETACDALKTSNKTKQSQPTVGPVRQH